MKDLSWFFERLLCVDSSREAVIFNDKIVTYKELLFDIDRYHERIIEENILPGDPVCVLLNFNSESIALLLSLIKNCNIIVPIIGQNQNVQNIFNTVQVKYKISMHNDDKISIYAVEKYIDNRLLRDFSLEKKPGIVLFTSGTTGNKKAVLHDLTKLLSKYMDLSHPPLRTISFMYLDHIGGIDTLFDIFVNGGTVIMTESRDPFTLCGIIEKYKVELLPTTPSFLNLLLLSKEHENHDLSSLKIITYGAEPIMDSVLKGINSVFPNVKMIQKYGLTETGAFRTKSKNNESKWIKMNDKKVKMKIKDSKLYVKTDSSMLGYLNDKNPFDEEGYYPTGDLVEVEGEYIRIIGRETEIINVGGEKVLPLEIENLISEIPEVLDVIVFGKPNPILGQVVAANIVPSKNVSQNELKKKIRAYCRGKLEEYKIPVEIKLIEHSDVSLGLKKTRKQIKNEHFDKSF